VSRDEPSPPLPPATEPSEPPRGRRRSTLPPRRRARAQAAQESPLAGLVTLFRDLAREHPDPVSLLLAAAESISRDDGASLERCCQQLRTFGWRLEQMVPNAGHAGNGQQHCNHPSGLAD
jgi:hypothetical protein